MPRSISLGFYSVEVRDRKTEALVPLGQITPSGDFFDFLAKVFADIQAKPLRDKAKQKYVTIGNLDSKKGNREIKGLFKSGDFGQVSDLVDITDGKLKHQRKITEADTVPLYFLASIPAKSTRGMICFQRFSQTGVYSSVRNSIFNHFQNTFPAFKLEISSLGTDRLLKRMKAEGEVKSIEISEIGVRPDLADALGLSEADSKKAKVHFVVTSARQGPFRLKRNIETLLKKEEKHARRLVKITNVNYSKITVGMTLNNRYRKISVEKGEAFRPYFDITEEVDKEINGHPKFASIDSLAHEFFEDFSTPSAASTSNV